jgi:hypothetical protein
VSFESPAGTGWLLAYTSVSFRVAQLIAAQKPFMVDFIVPIAVID